MKVITLSKTFLQGHPRAGEPTGFREAFLGGRKLHTIRANAKGYYKTGDIISVRQWSGKPYASKQEVIRDGVEIAVVNIYISERGVFFWTMSSLIPGKIIARNDGLSLPDFLDWFKMKETGGFLGSLIYLTDFRYGKLRKRNGICKSNRKLKS